MLTDGAVNRDNSVLDFCRLHDMTIQAWSPFQYGFFEGEMCIRDRFYACHDSNENGNKNIAY